MASDQPLVFRSGFNGTMSSDLYEAALAGTGTDMKLEVGPSGDFVTAHTNVVRTQSKVLDAMLKDTWTENMKQKEEISVVLPEDDFEEFKLFLKYLYGNQELTERNFHEAIPVWKLADKYAADNVLALMTDYFQFLLDNLTTVDVVNLLLVATNHRCEALSTPALAYVKSNLHLFWLRSVAQADKNDWHRWPEKIICDILSTDSLIVIGPTFTSPNWELNESWLLRFATGWLDNYYSEHAPLSQQDRQALATRILQNIRFCQLGHEQFKYCVRLLFEDGDDLNGDQLAIITLAHSGVSNKSILKRYGPNLPFQVDRRSGTNQPKRIHEFLPSARFTGICEQHIHVMWFS